MTTRTPANARASDSGPSTSTTRTGAMSSCAGGRRTASTSGWFARTSSPTTRCPTSPPAPRTQIGSGELITKAESHRLQDAAVVAGTGRDRVAIANGLTRARVVVEVARDARRDEPRIEVTVLD